MSASSAISYSVEAYNLSVSENKIHDDTVARQFGFVGGLVPGVEVYAYATHPVVQRWGRSWLERGEMECRFLKPVYDGRVAVATANPEGDALVLDVQSAGAMCATGRASLGASSQSAPVPEAYPERIPPSVRPPADPKALATGTWLSAAPVRPRQTSRANICAMSASGMQPISKTAWHTRVGSCVCATRCSRTTCCYRPGCTSAAGCATSASVELATRSPRGLEFVDNYERKGHRLVDLDVILIANDKTVVAQVLHTAIYQLRQASSA